jgi:PhnB protein
MTNEVRSLLEGYLPVIHYFCCKDAAANIECYKTAFGATELESMRIAAPDGKIGHTEIRIGNASIMITNEFPKYNMRSPRSIGGSPVSILLYVNNVDGVARRAVAAGAKTVEPVRDQFYGDQSGRLEDPFGHIWWVARHKEEISPESLNF